jgi:hypothetical protein
MATLAPMPPIKIDQADLIQFGQTWISNGERLSRTPPQSSDDLGNLFNAAVGSALATMLGGIPIVRPARKSLIPPQADCVEVGPVKIIGGVRPQDFDVGYRPDGIRFVLDSKTLNDRKSIGKNWQNMINDLATEATTVHSRFPHAVVGFMVIYPAPCVSAPLQRATIETLERLARRSAVDGPLYMAEAISLVLWHPSNGSIDAEVPASSSPLRFEKFSEQVEAAYIGRYKGLPPHTD